jgi:membrane associated rhomboid family serine protease
MAWKHRMESWHELESAGRPGQALRGLLLSLGLIFLVQAPLRLEGWALLHPEEALGQGKLWQLVTYAFLHQNLLHVLFNGLGLWVFGTELEKLWGARSFLLYCLLCAVWAGVAHALLDPWLSGRPTAVMGASGAVYGLMGAYGLLFRARRLYFWGLFPIRADVLALCFAAFALYSGVAQSSDGTAHLAHLGGMVGGVAMLLLAPAREEWRFWRHRRRMAAHLRRASQKAGNSSFPLLGPEADESRVRLRLDEVLEKVSRTGLSSLDPGERGFLDAASAWLREHRKGRP